MRLFILFFLLSMTAQTPVPCCSDKQLRLLAQNADFVVIAEIVETKPTPGFWSGQFAAIQIVRYDIKESIKGGLSSGVIDAGHYLVHGSCSADRSKPQLSPELFRKGNRLVLFLSHEEKGGYLVRDENCGAIASSAETVAKIRGLISVS